METSVLNEYHLKMKLLPCSARGKLPRDFTKAIAKVKHFLVSPILNAVENLM